MARRRHVPAVGMSTLDWTVQARLLRRQCLAVILSREEQLGVTHEGV